MQEIPEEKLNIEELDFSKLDFEAQQNLIGFFSLLLKIDKRNNRNLYKNNNFQNSDENNRDTNNTY